MGAAVDGLGKAAQAVFNAIKAFLPGSPFQFFINALDNVPYLKELNWFIPIDTMIVLTQTWLGAILIWYIYQPILRAIRAIS